MKGLTNLFSRIAGIIATLIGLISIIGAVVFVANIGFSEEMIKPIILCIVMFIAGISLLRSKHGIGHVAMCIVMIAVVVLEMFVWVGGIFAFSEIALALITESVDVVATFAKVYEILAYVTMACSILAMICRVLALSIKED